MKTRLTLSSKNNPCPLCGNTSGKDRTNGDIWMCSSFADSSKGETVGGYKVLSHSKDRFWAILKLDNSYEWSEERKQEWENLKVARQQKARREEQQQQQRALSSDDRHRWNSKILNSLLMDDRLIADLKKRGFTPEEITACGFKSVQKWQKLEFEVDTRLPGISKDRKSLVVGDDGYLCPIRDYEQRIIAFQLRLHSPQDGNRYRWLSTPKTATLQLYPEGENPLAVFHPEGKPEGIALVEGTGAKPFLTSRRFNLLAIGAAGGQFSSSRHLLEKYLDQAYQKLGGEKVVTLFPDAGDVVNKQVVNRWETICELLTKLGWNFRFAWWGQTTKDLHSDVDELDKETEIKFITGQEFFTIAKVGIKNTEKRQQDEEKRLKKEQKFNNAAAARNALTHITEVPYKVVNVPHMKEVLNDLIEPGTINIILSDTGTGKSESIVPMAREADAIYSWHNRISLGKMMSTTLGINYKDDVSRYSKRKAAFCSPSAYQFAPKELANKGILLIDECDQVFDFNFGSLCNKDGIRPLILSTLESQLEAVIAGKGIALCMSADVTQKEIDYIKALAPEGTPVRLIVNKYQPKRPDIHVDFSSNPDALVDILLEKLRAGIPCFVLDDMKNGVRGCKSLAEYVRTTMPEIAQEVIEIHADNSSDPNVQTFFSNPDKESEKYRLIICSPSVVSGVSLKNQRFINGVFGFCNGILIDREIKQFLNRVRGAQDIYLWIAEEGFPVRGIDNNLMSPDEIKAYYQRNYEANSKHILSLKPEYEPIKGEWSSPHFDLYCKNLAYRVATMKDLRKFTIEHLKQIGYGIIELNHIPEGGTKAIEDKLKAIWTGIEVSEAEAIAAARFLTESEMEALDFSQEAIPPELLPAYRKTKMRQQFGEELIIATTYHHKRSNKDFTGYAAMALKNVRGDYARQLEAFYMLSQDVGESIARDVAAENRQEKRGHGRFSGDIRWNARKRKCREWLGLPNFLKPGEWWEPKDYQELAEKAKSQFRIVKDTLGLTVENISNGQIFGELMRQVGLSLDTKEVAGQKWKLRTLNQKDWEYCQMYVVYKESLKNKEVPAAATPEVENFGFTVESLAEVLPLAETKKMYEELIYRVDETVVEGALQLVGKEVRDRLNNFYFTPEPIQLSLEDAPKMAAEPTTQKSVVEEFLPVSKENEAVVTVDESIRKYEFGFEPETVEKSFLWTRRLNNAIMMSSEIAKSVYTALPKNILDDVWRSLSNFTQQQYCELFASG